MSAKTMAARLDALEDKAGIGANTIEIVKTYQRADGSEYTTRVTWDRAEYEAWCEEQEAKLQEREARIDPATIDPTKASINDLLFAGHYAEVVRRVDTWHQSTSMDLPRGLIELADALRPHVAEGR